MMTHNQSPIFVNPLDDKPYGIIYLVTNKVNEKKYVGQTIHNAEKRWNGHLRKAKSHPNSSVINRAITKYRKEGFDVVEIDQADSKDELDYMERYWIKFYRTMDREYGYNRKEGGANGIMCPESIEKMAAALRGRKLPEGHPFTIKGKVAPMKGRKRKVEWNLRHSQIIKEGFASGKFKGNKGKVFANQRHSVLCVETGENFESRALAASFIRPGKTMRENRGIAAYITRAVKSGKAAFGYHWKEAI